MAVAQSKPGPTRRGGCNLGLRLESSLRSTALEAVIPEGIADGPRFVFVEKHDPF